MQIGECTVILPEETDSGRFYIVLGAGQLLHLELYLSWHLRNCLFFFFRNFVQVHMISMNFCLLLLPPLHTLLMRLG